MNLKNKLTQFVWGMAALHPLTAKGSEWLADKASTLRYSAIVAQRKAVLAAQNIPAQHDGVPLLPILGAYDQVRPLISSTNCASEAMIERLRRLTRQERERLAFETGTMVMYFPSEVAELRRMEEEAALKAVPAGHPLERLNGLNVGCGDRLIDPRLVSIDAHRGAWSLGNGSSDHYTSGATLLAWADELPFAPGTIDFILALHILEHLPNPAAVVSHWLDIIKPGGGIGIVVPDWRYTWDARNDNHPWGHRINATPELLRDLYEQSWRDRATLESIQTYPYRLSFDLVLRKHGPFEPFDDTRRSIPTGLQLATG